MGFLIALLTVAVVLDCVILILLVLIQLPKKEAGAGLAFGAGATDALFGAGSGTVLTKITRYAATTFFVLAFLVGIMQSRYSSRRTTEFERMLAKPSTSATIPGAAVAPAPAGASGGTTTSSNVLL